MIELRTRFATDEELQQRYGKQGVDFCVFPGNRGYPVVKVYLYQGDGEELAVKFPRRLPVNEKGETIDPLKPTVEAALKREQDGFYIQETVLTGHYIMLESSVQLLSDYRNCQLCIFEVSRVDEKTPPRDLLDKIVVNDGVLRSSYIKMSDDKKTVTIYVLVTTTTRKLKDLTVKLEV